MQVYPQYDIDTFLRLTIRNYMALRQHVPRLRSRDLADLTRANAYANAKNVSKIIDQYDPPPDKRR